MPRGSASVDEDHVPRTQKRELHGSNGCEHAALVCLHMCVSFCLEMGRPLVSGVITTRFFNFLNFLNFFFFCSNDGFTGWLLVGGGGDSLCQVSKFSELFFFAITMDSFYNKKTIKLFLKAGN